MQASNQDQWSKCQTNAVCILPVLKQANFDDDYEN